LGNGNWSSLNSNSGPERLAGTSHPNSTASERHAVVSRFFIAAVLVGTLHAIKLSDAVRFALPNPTLNAVLFVFAAPQLAFDLQMCAFRHNKRELAELRPRNDPMPLCPRFPFILIVSPRRFVASDNTAYGVPFFGNFCAGSLPLKPMSESRFWSK
jgi:hypothetical protein